MSFLAHYRGDTLRAYSQDLRYFLRWCTERNIEPLEAQRPHLELYLRWMEQRALAPSTIGRRFTTVSGFYRYAVIDGHCQKDPSLAVTRSAVERLRRRLSLMVVKRLALVLLLVPLLAACSGNDGTEAATSPAPTTPMTEEAVPAVASTRTGPVGEGVAAARCVEEYSAATIGNRDFSFDGTVTSIGSGGTNRPGKGELDTASVTFRVNEWFRGGVDATVTVDMSSLTSVDSDETPAFEEGTRLLVSGEPRWGGEPLEDAIAWSCGGFTQYYEAAVADEWRRGTT